MAANTKVSLSGARSSNQTSRKVILDVGGRKFNTFASTLYESEFLRTMLSKPWANDQEADASFFIDADPDLFSHVLQYLRRNQMPLFWDPEKGHDLGRYKSLLEEAEYFLIPDLANWLSRQEYLKAITANTTVMQKRVPLDTKIELPAQKSNVRLEWREEEVHFCGSPYTMHSSPKQCSFTCFRDQQGIPTPSIKEWFLTAVVMDEKLIFDPAVFRP